MGRRKLIRVTTDPRMQGPFAWPFKVLRDLFSCPPFVADPEFTPFDVGALRSNVNRPSSGTRKSAFFVVDRARLILWWFIGLVVVPLLSLVVLEWIG
jgi:hypothetical protein